ncbi:MAG TPA: diguanylate cyclase [Pyrinomonadaceae bacterium]|nr:diguanylate cyclase [Pyrinomonadaceae bacterium]
MKQKSQTETLPGQTARTQRRVLLISDEPSFSFRATLEAGQLEVVEVSAAIAAPISLRRSRPQIVIANLPISGLSIKELARILHNSHDGVPLILVGAEAATLERRRESMAAGAFDYFQVPAEDELVIASATRLVKLQQTMERLRGEADLDHLTGLANRRRFRVALSREVERWRRYGTPCALLLLDIDYMKAINDTYGHPAGDLVIREVGNTLILVSRDNDTPARVGGEEFALLFAGIDEPKAVLAANRLRAILAEQRIEGIGNITVSIGVAACPAHADSERTLYAASDSALYEAKNKGRNRVAIAPKPK